ncbi:hypothetical protein [Chromobacterium sp. IIBBL 290-4]|uniref:hypothetical protein n=1 Tax=Chromobacterium sp. IIBBL 290-4 TaxID=2953890 RepID=UPI0020B75C2E|nr:hypothetical protein [Chromobacterium sp. IIBBL 290-4]UTH74797.1 hypothetical protein NKT35_01435 [Chromobacterium sp. IIBBL 290-4]
MKYTKILSAIALIGAALSAHAADDAARFAIGAGVGTTGFDLMATYKLADSVNLRGVLSGFDYSTSGNYGTDTHYDAKFKLFQAGLLADYFPFDNGFRLSGGLVANNTKIGLNANASGHATYTLNGYTYTADQIGKLEGESKWNKPGLYLGLGFGNSVKEKGLSLSGDLGVILTGKPSTNLSANCTSALSQAQCQQLQYNVNVEQEKLRGDMNKANFWPVARLTLNYAF